MKRYLILLGSILAVGLSSCSNQSKTVEKVRDNTPFPMEVNTFTFEQLFQAGEGGCGMVLWKPDAIPQQDGILFFHGLGKSFLGIMTLDSEIVGFNRTSASGQEFYGQQTSQTFVSEDGKVTLSVDVNLGKAGEIESINIPEGTITLKTQGKTKKIAVMGDAGC